MSHEDLAGSLLAWYDKEGRSLPWREDPSPYHVWISEIMLQQTRAAAVTGYYARFLSAFPDIPALAAAPEDQVIKAWEGLGYYSRARNLHKAARLLVSDYGGALPEDYEDLKRIPGIGDYTAAAIASIAFSRPVPAVDGNLLRVFARMEAYGEDILKPAARKAAFSFYAAFMDRERPGDFNQALMDLGSLVCLPGGGARCPACPWRKACRCGRDLSFSSYPRRSARKPRRICPRTIFVIRRGDRVLLRKRPSGGVLAGLYEFPGAEGHLSEEEAVLFLRDLGLSPLRLKRLPEGRHIFTHLEWDMRGYEVLTDDLAPASLSGGLVDADIRQLEEEYAVPSAFALYRTWLEDREDFSHLAGQGPLGV